MNSSIKTKISDAEEMAYGKLKVSKESVGADPEILAVYEACQKGIITEDQRENLIDEIKVKRITNDNIEGAYSREFTEDLSLKEKYNEVKKLVYEKCANGDISENDREIILKEAYNRIFGVSESTVNDAAAGGDVMKSQSNKNEDASMKADLKEMKDNIDKDYHLDNKTV